MNEAELWRILMECSRGSTTTWTAWETLHGHYSKMKRRLEPCECGSIYNNLYSDGSEVCQNMNYHRRNRT